jgi:conjugal transfer pilus assembly protein TraF
VLTNDDTQQGRTDDPKVWVKYLKDRLESRY